MYIKINYFFRLKTSADLYPCLLLQRSTIEVCQSVPKDSGPGLSDLLSLKCIFLFYVIK